MSANPALSGVKDNSRDMIGRRGGSNDLPVIITNHPSASKSDILPAYPRIRYSVWSLEDEATLNYNRL